MGTQVLSGNQNDSKHQMAVSTVLAAAVAIGAGELVVWIGNALNGNQVEIIEALNRCRDALRESGTPNPAALSEVVALSQPGAPKSAVTVTDQAALPTITEADVFIGYGNGYLPTSGGSSRLLDDRIDAALDKLLEDALKAA